MSKKSNTELFKEALERVGDGLQIFGDVLIVERLPKRELKTKSGIILTGHKKQLNSIDSNQPEFVKVLAIGDGYITDSGENVDLSIQPGYVIEVGRNSVNWFTSFGNIVLNADTGSGIGLTREVEGRLRFKSEEAYNKFMDVFYSDDVTPSGSASTHDAILNYEDASGE